MAKPKDGGHVYQIQTVPPPGGETDAYSAPTKVGPMPAAIAEMISEATRQADEEETAQKKAALRARPIIPREEPPDDPPASAAPTKPPPPMPPLDAGAPSSRPRPVSSSKVPARPPSVPIPQARTTPSVPAAQAAQAVQQPQPTEPQASPLSSEPTPAVIAAAMLNALETPPPIVAPPPSGAPIASSMPEPSLTPPLHHPMTAAPLSEPQPLLAEAPTAAKPKSRIVTLLILIAIFGLVALAGYRLVYRRLR